MDEVIAATGFRCPLGDLETIGVTTFGRSGLPSMTNAFESATAPGIYFGGTITQGVSGLKKFGIPANSGAVHGHRYNGRIIVEGRPDALIRTHLAPEVVEVDCAPDEEAALLDGTVPPRHRLRVGRRVMLYVDDASPLVERMHQRDPSNQRALVVRPTNLEDVYLRLTGTSLEAA